MDKNFKNICLNAIKSFELIDKLKLMRNEVARPEGYESFSSSSSRLSPSSRIEEIKKLCADLKSSVEFVTNKKCIHLIKRRVNKKKNKKSTSRTLFYHSELENLLRNKELFWENDSLSSTNKNANSINLFDSFQLHRKKNQSSSNGLIENDSIKQLARINNELSDLKDLREHLSAHCKLIAIRSQHLNKQPNQNISITKLNDLISQVDERNSFYEIEKCKLKEQIRLFTLNSLELEELRKKENLNSVLNQTENSIREQLFGADNINKSFGACNLFELFQRQAENSIQNLILIRQEWDNFQSDSSRAESVPIEWVHIDSLSTDREWAGFARLTDIQ